MDPVGAVEAVKSGPQCKEWILKGPTEPPEWDTLLPVVRTTAMGAGSIVYAS
jgi:hypothetical protein